MSSDSGRDRTYVLGESIRVAVSFSEAVAVDTAGGTPELAIDMDPAEWGRKQAAYESGSGSATLTFVHVVVEPNLSTRGIAVLENTLELGGGSIRSAVSGADAALGHSGLGHDPEHRVDWRRSPSAPAVTGVEVTSDAGADATYVLGESISVAVSFSEAVAVTGVPQLRIDMDPAEWGEKVVPYAGGSGTATLTFVHVVVEPNFSTRGIAVLADTLELNGGSLRSAVSGADAALGHSGLGHDPDHRVDWRRSAPDPNQVPVVDTAARNHARFSVRQNAPRGMLVSKPFHGIFSDSDGDELSYSVAVTGGDARLVDLLQVTLDAEVRVGGLKRSPMGIYDRVFFRADSVADWNAFTPRLPQRPVVTVTLTATDPGGLSASVSGDFEIHWEAHLELEGFGVTAEPGDKTLLATWNPVEGATSYRLRWRSASGEFSPADTATVTDAAQFIAVADFGPWEVRVQACNDAGCGPEAIKTADAAQAANLRLERPVDAEGRVRSRTITATWDEVKDAASYTLRWRRLSADAPAPAAQSSAAGAASANSGADSGPPSRNQLTVSAEGTAAELAMPDDGAYWVDLQALGDDGELIAAGDSGVNQVGGGPDTTPPWLVRGEIYGDRVYLYFSEPLDENSVGGRWHPFVQRRACGCWTGGITHAAMEVSGNKVIVDFEGGIRAVEGLRAYIHYLAYPHETSLQDLAGNRVRTPNAYYDGDRSTRTISLRNITGQSPAPPAITDSTEPSLSDATVEGTRLTLIYDEALDEDSVPAASAFALNSDGSTIELADTNPVAVDNFWVTLTLASAIAEGEDVTVSYTKPTAAGAKKVRDKAGNEAASFADQAAGPDDTLPTLVRGEVDGDAMTLYFSEPLDEDSTPSASAFTVSLQLCLGSHFGCEATFVATGQVEVERNTVVVGFGSGREQARAGMAAYMSYRGPTSTTAKKLRDLAGNEVTMTRIVRLDNLTQRSTS